MQAMESWAGPGNEAMVGARHNMCSVRTFVGMAKVVPLKVRLAHRYMLTNLCYASCKNSPGTAFAHLLSTVQVCRACSNDELDN